MKLYAYASYSGEAIAVGSSERGTKAAATKNRSTEIGYISTINNMYIPTHRKVGNKWVAI